MIEEILKAKKLTPRQKSIALSLFDTLPSEDEIADVIVLLIDQLGMRFQVSPDFKLATSNCNTLTKVNVYYINISILYNILYKYIVQFPQLATSTEYKYLNLLNLDGEPSFLDLSSFKDSKSINIKYLDSLSKLAWKLWKRYVANTGLYVANTQANKKSIFNIEIDNKESIKIAIKGDEKRKQKLKSEQVVSHLRKKIVDYNTSIGAASYFKDDWLKKNMISVYRMRKVIDPDLIIKAIDWFFDNPFWADKIDSMDKIEKHFNKFAAQSRSSQSSKQGLLSRRLQEIDGISLK